MKRSPIKRRPKTPLAKAKEKLWQLCREIIIKKYGRTCYTCGRQGLEGGNCQLGHFIPSSICSAELRYDLDNLRPQCYHCNINLSGNWPAYEAHLKLEKGDSFPDNLKKLNEATKGMKADILFYEAKAYEYQNLL